jgi:hypothetical protein
LHDHHSGKRKVGEREGQERTHDSRLLVGDARADGGSRGGQEEGVLEIGDIGDEEGVAEDSSLAVRHLASARGRRRRSASRKGEGMKEGRKTHLESFDEAMG